MSVASFIKSELIEPVVIWLVPGLIALFPFLLIVNNFYPDWFHLPQDKKGFEIFLLVIFALGSGFIMDSIGSHIEVGFIDKKLQCKSKIEGRDHWRTWYKYLRLDINSSIKPVGQKYIHQQVIHLKFEVNLAASILFSWVGFILFQIQTTRFDWISFIIILVLSPIAVGYLIYEAYLSGKNLGKVREELLKGPPIGY